MKIFWGSEGTAPHILNCGTRWRWVVKFMPQMVYSWGRALVPIFTKRLGVPHSP